MLRYTTIAILALSLAGSGVSAAPAPGGPPVSMDAADQTVQQLAANLSKQASVPIVVEANVDTKFGGGFNQAPLEQVLNALAKTSQVKWFKVYLPEDTTPEDMLREARQQVALLQSIREKRKTIIFDAATGLQTTVVCQEPPASGADEQAKQLGLKPAYYIASDKPAAVAELPAPDEKLPPEVQQYATLEMQRERAFLKLTPEQRLMAMQQSMQNELAMNPTDRVEMARARAESMRAMFTSNSPIAQQYREAQRQTWQTLRDSGAIPDFGRGRGGDRGGDRGRR